MARRAASFRVLLALQLAAVAAAAAATLLVVGIPLLARPTAGRVLLLAAAVAVAVLVAGALVLGRAVARPVDRMLAAAERLGEGGGLPVLGEAAGHRGLGGLGGLGAAAVAFERTAAALAEERAALAAKVEELTRANRALEEARESLVRSEKLATVGRLAAGIAHEVGNPLAAVSGYAAVARERAADPALRDLLERIAAEAERIDRIVRDLLDFARPAPARLGPVPLGPAVEAALRLARMQARFREVEASVAIPPDAPPVLADAGRLGQVLVNLLLNAGDAMEGRGAVTVTAAPDGDRVRLEIADTGPGIPEADLERVFEPFFTTKAPGRGAGLGLAVCHGIVGSFGGEIRAGNGARGAVMTLLLRAAGGAGGAPAAPW